VGQPIAFRLASDDVIHSFWVPMLGGKRDANPVRAVREGDEPEYTWFYVTVNEPGEYIGQCAEFCGQSHALMGMRVIAESPADFQAWIRDMNQPSPTALPPAPPDTTQGVEPPPAPAEDPLIAQGRDIFLNQSSCVACHAIQGTSAVGDLGPNLTRVGSHAEIAAGRLENTPENLFRWIRDPSTVKPDARMPGTERDATMPTGQGTWPATGLTDDQVRAVAAYLSSLR
jgi:cytochrome c oxidase subunit 2